MTDTVRLGLIQLRTPATQAEALAQASSLVREAAARGAAFIATPEGTNILQRDRAKLFDQLSTLETDVCVQGLRALADELRVEILIGSALVRRTDGQCANRAILIGADGAVRATYDKIHMFDVDLPSGERYRESSSYTPGGEAVVAPSAFGPLGLTICYDMRFPLLYQALAKAGAVALAVPAAFTRPTGEAHWETLLRARAIETGAYVFAPAQGGVHADGRATWGHSLVVEPWGAVVAKLDHDEPGVLIADLDLSKVAAARAAIPALKNGRTFRLPVPVDTDAAEGGGMIRYALYCEHDHPFEAWFGSSSDYDVQAARGQVECPMCLSTVVRKQIMSPAISTSRRREAEPTAMVPALDAKPDGAGGREVASPEAQAQMRTMMMEALSQVRRHVEDTFDYVGDSFAKEARDIHEGRSEQRGIYGEASPKEVQALLNDGITVAPLPPPPW